MSVIFVCVQVVGAGLIGLGVWAKLDPNVNETMKVFISDSSSTMRVYMDVFIYVAICVGACLLVIGFAGCCGAIRESTFLLGVV